MYHTVISTFQGVRATQRTFAPTAELRIISYLLP